MTKWVCRVSPTCRVSVVPFSVTKMNYFWVGKTRCICVGPLCGAADAAWKSRSQGLSWSKRPRGSKGRAVPQRPPRPGGAGTARGMPNSSCFHACFSLPEPSHRPCPLTPTSTRYFKTASHPTLDFPSATAGASRPRTLQMTGPSASAPRDES